jgi:hypothetical protein
MKNETLNLFEAMFPAKVKVIITEEALNIIKAWDEVDKDKVIIEKIRSILALPHEDRPEAEIRSDLMKKILRLRELLVIFMGIDYQWDKGTGTYFVKRTNSIIPQKN